MPWAVVTYSKAAAATLTRRGVPASTVYRASWPHVRQVAKLRPSAQGLKQAAAYHTRTITNRGDDALREYLLDAPSRKETAPELAEVYGWEPPQGDPPSWIWQDKLPPGTEFAVGLARWLAKGAPLTEEPLQFLAIDEAQDVQVLELAAAMALVHPEGEVLALGDPGQSIFLSSKGWPSDRLPPAWEQADETRIMEGGYRMGFPATDVAAQCLRSYYWRPPEVFSAPHATNVHVWDGQVPASGLVLGRSRYAVDKFIRDNDLLDTGVVPGPQGVLSVMSCHAAKGHEEDDVYLLPWGKKRSQLLLDRDPEEIKIAYVALTRARYNVYLAPEMWALLT